MDYSKAESFPIEGEHLEPTLEAYETQGRLFAIKCRLEHMMYGVDGKPVNDNQRAFNGARRFYNMDFSRVQLPYPEVPMEDMLRFINELFLCLPNDGQNPLLLDDILVALIQSLGENIPTRLQTMLDIANGRYPQEVSERMAQALIGYLKYWDPTRRTIDYIGGHQDALLDAIREEQWVSHPAMKVIKNLDRMMRNYGDWE